MLNFLIKKLNKCRNCRRIEKIKNFKILLNKLYLLKKFYSQKLIPISILKKNGIKKMQQTYLIYQNSSCKKHKISKAAHNLFAKKKKIQIKLHKRMEIS